MSGYHRPHILIVSDDLDLSQFLQSGLMYAGFFTSVVASAFQALELFRLRTFDLAVIDALLEGLGAESLVVRLRETQGDSNAPRTDIPIVLLAESDREVDERAALDMGANAIAYAPIDIEAFAVDLFGRIGQWREEHPDRLWADQLAQARD